MGARYIVPLDQVMIVIGETPDEWGQPKMLIASEDDLEVSEMEVEAGHSEMLTISPDDVLDVTDLVLARRARIEAAGE